MTEAKGYDPEVYKALEVAGKIAKDNSNRHYSGAHLLKALLNKDLSLLKALQRLDVDVYYMEEWAEVRMDGLPRSPNIPEAEPDPIIDVIMTEADQVKIIMGKDLVDLYCILVALSTPGVGFSYDQMKTFPTTRAELLDLVPRPVSIVTEVSGIASTSTPAKNNTANKGNFLSKYCIHKNLTQQATEYIIGRDMELNAMIEALCRFSKANVMIIGDHGVGKTTLINGFIQQVIQNQVPEILSQVQLFELDFGAVVAGASYKGEVEDRLKNIINELSEYPKAILIIEEIHSLLASNSGELGLANILKAELTKGLTIISTTTIEEFTKRIEKQQGLAGMFELIKLYEVDDETNFRMIKQSIQKYQLHHQINVNDATIWEAIRLSRRYMKEKSLPESAIDLIDHTMSVLKTAGETFLKEESVLRERLSDIKKDEQSDKEEQTAQAKWFLSDLLQKTKFLLGAEKEQSANLSTYTTIESLIERSETLMDKLAKIAKEKRSHIDIADLAVVIAQKTGIPAGKLQKEEQQKLHNMEETLKKRVVGQDHAIHVITESILESRSGLSKAGQPIGSFFFLGPTGTGKTELAKSLAEFLFQDENAIIRFDMSEFKEEHSAALLYGAPPGYVGYEEGGLLVNKIRQKPYSIVLFDEIEKAHPSVFDVFLQIMDEGKLHDRLGKEGDFSNAIILFTSNIGSGSIVESFNKGNIPQSPDLMEIMSKHFRPEFLGRLTEIIPFAPISNNYALKIFEIHLKKEFLDLLKNLKINIEVSNEAQAFLAQNGYNSTYGARPLKGIIRSRLRRPLAKKIVSGEVQEGSSVIVSLKDNELVWKISQPKGAK